ncbi:MAG TPA: Nramp family divalent metal transporter [Pyrinomonadaceae bacterium]|nr:Nramp family divalent metal transporter [Pyrinomonadaceae bacterium]
MKPQSEIAEGLEPIEEVGTSGLIKAPKPISTGLRLNIRGRSIYLRGLRLPPHGIWKWLLILGPGLIATSAGNDAGGIATYSSAGAKYGYQLIWVMVVLTVSYAVVQEMCSRLGAATGRGLLDLVREKFGLGWTLFAVGIIVIANGGVTISEFVGIGAATELFGVSKFISVPLAAAILWYLVIFGSYARVEKVFLLMTLVFFAYPVAAILAKPDWHEVLHGTVVPSVSLDRDYIFIIVGLLGTTMTPYIQVFQQSSIVERGASRRRYGPERLDAYFGSIFSNLMSVSMIIATAATLYVAGQTDIATAADAAKALQPVAGSSAMLLFAIGLLGASLLAGGVLPLATSYAISEAFGIPKGVNLDYRRGRVFFGLFTAFIVLGAATALVPGIPIFPLLVGIQVLNGVLLPIILVFILLLINDERLMSSLKNSFTTNILGWVTFALISAAVVTMLGLQIYGLFAG